MIQSEINRRQFIKGAILGSLSLSLPSLAQATKRLPTYKSKTNVIYILADDLGYGELGCYGQKLIKTPNIDNLAREGMKFTQHYAGSTVCAPSRCCLMTGLHTGHAYIRGNQPLNGYQLPLPSGTITVGHIFQKAGYKTAAIGKWGLGGPGSTGQPDKQGFDYFFGYLGQRQAHNYYPDHLWENNQEVTLKKGTYSHDLMTKKALDFIRKSKDKPFFLYLPYTIPHPKLQVPSLGQYKDKDWNKQQKSQAAMISRMDSDIGKIMKALKDLNIDDNTLVFFSSDNGAHGFGGTIQRFHSSGPLRGKKRDLYEGGIRVPLIARWPGRIKAGSTTDLISAFWDFLPTCAELVKVKAPDGLDGISFLPTLVGKLSQQKQHDYLYWEFYEQGGKQAVRKGNYKAIRLNVRRHPDGPIELYNLANDLGESKNIASQHPDIVKQMAAIMKQAHSKSDLFNFTTIKPYRKRNSKKGRLHK